MDGEVGFVLPPVESPPTLPHLINALTMPRPLAPYSCQHEVPGTERRSDAQPVYYSWALVSIAPVREWRRRCRPRPRRRLREGQVIFNVAGKKQPATYDVKPSQEQLSASTRRTNYRAYNTDRRCFLERASYKSGLLFILSYEMVSPVAEGAGCVRLMAAYV